jgi:negative regulator of flagellin synthesis FlgM
MTNEIQALGSGMITTPVRRAATGKSQAGVTAISPVVSDNVEISELGKWIARYNEMPDVRTEKVNQIKSQIASGRYESQDKFDLAIENLLEDL